MQQQAGASVWQSGNVPVPCFRQRFPDDSSVRPTPLSEGWVVAVPGTGARHKLVRVWLGHWVWAQRQGPS